MKFTYRYIILFILINLLTHNLFAAEYNIAIRTHIGIEYAIKQWKPTIDAISIKIPQHTFNIIPVVNLNEITERAGKGEFDFVLTNPSSFMELQVLFGSTNLVTLYNKRANTGQSRFGSVIFTHVRHEDILSIHDLKNKTFMAVSESAFGGWRVAWLEMLEQGFDPLSELKKLMFTKSRTHPEVVKAVRDGIADAGRVFLNPSFQYLSIWGKRFRKFYQKDFRED